MQTPNIVSNPPESIHSFFSWHIFNMHILATSFLSFKAQATFIGSPNWCATEGLSKSYWGSGCCNWPKRVSLCPYLLINNGCLVAVKCVVSSERDDGFYMRRCVEIAKKALGFTSPNPMVGCVIVKDGEIVGEGFHPKAGQPHAEVFALRDAGDLAENATAYVSLEPCNHFGRTPPCTEALIQAKVKHVVVGMVDPNPIVASKGVERLRKSGIEVKVGVEEELCKKLNEAYIHRMLTGRPFVALRYSLLLNGHMSNQLGEGAEEPGGYYSKLMQEYDGIIISSVHLAKDSSALKFEETGARQPLLIIVATPSNSPICLPTPTTGSQAIVFKDKHAVIDQATELNLHQVGTEIVVLEQMDLESILDYCGQKGLCSVLIDLRGRCGDFMEIIRKGLEDGLLQKLIMELLPVWVGKKESLLVEYNNLGERTVKLKDLQTKVLNGSVMVDGYIC